MVLTNNQTLLFWTEQAQMGVSARTRGQLMIEGLTNVEDLFEFADNDDGWKQLLENLKHPPQVLNPAVGAPGHNAGVAVGALIPQVPFQLSARSLGRMKNAARVVKYYTIVQRALTAANMQQTRLGNFKEQWEAHETNIENQDQHKLPVITKYLPIVAWIEAFTNHLVVVCGVRKIPLAHCIRETVVVGNDFSPLAADQCYSVEHGSLRDEMIARASHTNPMFRVDSATIFDMIEKSTRTTAYAATIAPFRRSKDGVAAFHALVSQHAGVAYWDTQKKDSNETMSTLRYTGGGQMTLEQLSSKHRQAYVKLTQCADHVPVELPGGRQRVTNLIDSIQCNDADVSAAVAAVKVDEQGMRQDFESAVAFVVPTCPVAKKTKKSKKRNLAQISSTSTTNNNNNNKGRKGRKKFKAKKVTKGPRTGVELRFHKDPEYKKLTDEQKEELRELRNARDKKGEDDPDIRTQVAAIFAELDKEKAEKEETFNTLKSMLSSLQVPADNAKVGAVNLSDKFTKQPSKKKTVAAVQVPQDEKVEAAATQLMEMLKLGGKKSDGRS